jgi:hypothetical protein
MAEQKFSAAEREAIWLAHNGKCAYTRALIDISSFHIDHILPEKLADNAEEFAEIREKLELPPDFDLRGFGNLLPCAPGVNLQKSSMVFGSAQTRFFLGIAEGKRSAVEKNLQQIEKRTNRGRALILLQQGLEKGELSPDDVAKILEDYDEEPQEIFALAESMEFADATEIKAIAKADIDDLRNRPVKMGQNDAVEGLTLTDSSGKEIVVKTCKEYDDAIRTGYSAYTNFDIKMSAWFVHQCGLLTALQTAATATTSFIAEPKVGIVDLNLMPFSLFPQFGDPVDHGNATYQSKLDDGSLKVKRLRGNVLVVETDDFGQQLVEVARADFNGDGVEEILAFEYRYATQGTLEFGRIRILAREGPNSLFEDITADMT